MSRLSILTGEEQNEFDYPPVLSLDVKMMCLNLTKELENKKTIPEHKSRRFQVIPISMHLNYIFL